MASSQNESSRQGSNASRKVLITGVSKGLGRALALELATRGHTIIGCSRDQTKLDSLQEQLSKSSPIHHFLFPLDVRSNKNVEEFAQIIGKQKLVPDIIVNNAGLAHEQVKIWELDAQDFDNVIDTNIKGIANVLRHFLPLMMATKQGIVVNISSSAGRDTHENFSAYCSSKWAIEGLSKCVAKGVAEGMAVVALDPGFICTDMLHFLVGDAATRCQSPEKWAMKAATMILDFTSKDNGASLTIEDEISAGTLLKTSDI
ncbi:NADPH-dependent pterin aldehyde reductase-like isoform X1 [Cucurbita moschata]|uniref:NADPH-dependent pterin aldehyde reductase-like isoform X1 n=1 Tax=Cucurbita moschata TaxID=3662 RepID=A0A6J1ETL0_CUCMO|nr:NADPH-dependent pterin aldehyde reductase-like isoform X1 [Cucurbita moschata]